MNQQTPVVDKLVSVVAEVEHPVTVRVPIGTTIEEVVALAGGTTSKRSGIFYRRTDDGIHRKRFAAGYENNQCGTGIAAGSLSRKEKKKANTSYLYMKRSGVHAAVSVQCVQIYVQDICLDTRFSHTCLCVRQHAKTFSSRISLSIHSSAVHVVSVSYIPVRRSFLLEH